MRKQIIENAAFQVATQVRAVEDTIDSALTEIAELQARMIRVSAVAHAGFGTINPALEQLAAALRGLVEVRGSVASCHAALAEAKGKVPGLRETAWGDGEECPEEEGASHLRVVA